VLLTGDGNDNAGRMSFIDAAERALQEGWLVEVWAWRGSTSRRYVDFAREYSSRLAPTHTSNCAAHWLCARWLCMVNRGGGRGGRGARRKGWIKEGFLLTEPSLRPFPSTPSAQLPQHSPQGRPRRGEARIRASRLAEAQKCAYSVYTRYINSFFKPELGASRLAPRLASLTS
jgi:hypothetical protein